MNVKAKTFLFILCIAIAISGIVLYACSEDEVEYVSSRSYKGHENDEDSNNFVNVYPNTVGTRLDDCQTCHRGGDFQYEKKGQMVDTFKNACDYCHLLIHPDDSLIGTVPQNYTDTLNAYGLDYLNAGRTRNAIRAIAGNDSDGDGYTNEAEVVDLKYPGDNTSMPGQQVAPQIILDMAELQELASHEEFMLANSHKQEFDDYCNYVGVKIIDLLTAVGVDPTDPNIVGVSVIAPDGYVKDFDATEINNQYPDGEYHEGLGVDTLGEDCGFVQYPDGYPRTDQVSGTTILDEQWLMLAYERDGAPMEPSVLDPTEGKLNGEGPYRIIVPQSDPGAPDRGSMYSPTSCGDGYDYDDTKDHNAGSMVRGVIAVRINPMPEGYEEFDYKYGGYAYIDSQELIIYGYGITGE